MQMYGSIAGAVGADPDSRRLSARRGGAGPPGLVPLPPRAARAGPGRARSGRVRGREGKAGRGARRPAGSGRKAIACGCAGPRRASAPLAGRRGPPKRRSARRRATSSLWGSASTRRWPLVELAALYLERAAVEPVRQLADEVLPVFTSPEVGREAIYHLLLFQQACETERSRPRQKTYAGLTQRKSGANSPTVVSAINNPLLDIYDGADDRD